MPFSMKRIRHGVHIWVKCTNFKVRLKIKQYTYYVVRLKWNLKNLLYFIKFCFNAIFWVVWILREFRQKLFPRIDFQNCVLLQKVQVSSMVITTTKSRWARPLWRDSNSQNSNHTEHYHYYYSSSKYNFSFLGSNSLTFLKPSRFWPKSSFIITTTT